MAAERLPLGVGTGNCSGSSPALSGTGNEGGHDIGGEIEGGGGGGTWSTVNTKAIGRGGRVAKCVATGKVIRPAKKTAQQKISALQEELASQNKENHYSIDLQVPHKNRNAYYTDTVVLATPEPIPTQLPTRSPFAQNSSLEWSRVPDMQQESIKPSLDLRKAMATPESLVSKPPTWAMTLVEMALARQLAHHKEELGRLASKIEYMGHEILDL